MPVSRVKKLALAVGIVAALGLVGAGVCWRFWPTNASQTPGSEATQPSTISTQVIVIAPDGSSRDARQEFIIAQFAGDYYVGDGLGYNLSLVLKEDTTFECTWVGCLGVYGKAEGNWSINAAGLNLLSSKAEGLLEKRPLDKLLVVAFHGHFLLLQSQDRDWFDKSGPSERTCFHKVEAQELLREEYRRNLDRQVKKLLDEEDARERERPAKP
jgi:hypothetical protein